MTDGRTLSHSIYLANVASCGKNGGKNYLQWWEENGEQSTCALSRFSIFRHNGGDVDSIHLTDIATIASPSKNQPLDPDRAG